MDSTAVVELLSQVLADYICLNDLSSHRRAALEALTDAERASIHQFLWGEKVYQRMSMACLMALLERRYKDDRVDQFLLACQLGISMEIDSSISEYYRNRGLVAAARGGHLELVRQLSASVGSVTDAALLAAAAAGQLAVVLHLLTLPDAKPREALRVAAAKGRLHVVVALLERGVKVEREALEAAIRGKHFDVLEALLSRKTNIDGNRLLSEVTTMAALRLLMAHFPGLDLGLAATELLFGSLFAGDAELFQFSLSQGASMSRYSVSTMGQGAGVGGNMTILVSLASNIKQPLEFYQAALDEAVTRGHAEMVSFILSQPFPVKVNQAVAEAAALNRVEMLRSLLATSRASELSQALSQAVSHGHLEPARVLLEAGARPSAQDLETAHKYYPDVEELLLTA